MSAKCRYPKCKEKGDVKFYVIADDLEHPRPYHPACIKKLMDEALIELLKRTRVTGKEGK